MTAGANVTLGSSSIRQVYRHVLRVVWKEITSVAGNADTEEYMRREFRRMREMPGQAAALELARDWANLVAAIHGHKVSSRNSIDAPGDSGGYWHSHWHVLEPISQLMVSQNACDNSQMPTRFVIVCCACCRRCC